MAGLWKAVQALQARMDKLEGKKAPAAAKPPRVRKPAKPS